MRYNIQNRDSVQRCHFRRCSPQPPRISMHVQDKQCDSHACAVDYHDGIQHSPPTKVVHHLKVINECVSISQPGKVGTNQPRHQRDEAGYAEDTHVIHGLCAGFLSERITQRKQHRT